jgi:hypothetical protein
MIHHVVLCDIWNAGVKKQQESYGENEQVASKNLVWTKNLAR